MTTQRFHLGDVLSITTGRLVSPRHIDGVYDILNFMTGDNLSTIALPRASDVCKPHLLRQFPQLDDAQMKEALVRLSKSLTGTNRDDCQSVVNLWVKEQAAKYGEYFDVESLPDDTYESKHPIDEAIGMGVDPEKIVVVQA
jgi:hypothetical protein